MLVQSVVVAVLLFVQSPTVHEGEETAEAPAVAEEITTVLAEARSALERADAALAAGDATTARIEVRHVVELLVPLPLGEGHDETAEVLWGVGFTAYDVGLLAITREAWSRVVAHRERTLREEDPHLILARYNLASAMSDLGERAAAHVLFEEVFNAEARILPEDHPALLKTRSRLAQSMFETGDLTGARLHYEAVLAARMQSLAEDDPDLLATRVSLAILMRETGDLVEARAVLEEVLAAQERTLPEDHPELLGSRGNLAVLLSDMGDLAGARLLQDAVLAARERTLPEDHPELLAARVSQAMTMNEMGDPVGARRILEEVLIARERTLPEDHHDLLITRANLAIVMRTLGDLQSARLLTDAVLVGLERTLPKDHSDLLSARANLAVLMADMGDLVGARALAEEVLAARLLKFPENHPDVLNSRTHLANTMSRMGDLSGARALKEAVLAIYERTMPDEHPAVQRARANLAASMSDMGDFAGARALKEAVLAVRERTLSKDHPDLIWARFNLAASMLDMGELHGARVLQEVVLSDLERTLPENHPDLFLARTNLAVTMFRTGDFSGARALQEAVLAGREKTLSKDHPDVLSARSNLAASMSAMGDQAGARTLREAVLEARERTLPGDHPDLLSARADLALSMSAMGDLAGMRALLPTLCSGVRSRILAALALSPREARQTVADEGQRLAAAYFWSRSEEPEHRASLFELTETMRIVSGEAARSLSQLSLGSDFAPVLVEAALMRRELSNLVAGADGSAVDAKKLTKELARLSLQRDRLEGQASRLLAERGVVMQPLEITALTRALRASGGKGAAVGYRRLKYYVQDEETGNVTRTADHLFANVLRADGNLTRVDLGPVSELEPIAIAWRKGLGVPLLSRGVELAEQAGDPEAEAGLRLRKRALDPVLAAAGEGTEQLFVCADDFVFLVPLDALPLDGGLNERVGDRIRIVNEVSFARLLKSEQPVESEPSLLALGAVDYDAEGANAVGIVAPSAPISGPLITSLKDGLNPDESPPVETTSGARSVSASTYSKLPETGREARAIAEVFTEVFELEPELLTHGETTKSKLFEEAAGKRYVHIATHGWFAPESLRSIEDASSDPAVSTGPAMMGLEESVSGFAPMTLCGLALAGANNGRDSLGRVPGILTAEELCSLDLSECELAVLSGCETNVGVRRAGEGIQSLQAALYAAGARTSITSLWEVDDAATRSLMELFYENLWVRKMGKAEALWSAKRTLREEGDPPSAWAGWVLTGDPD